MVSDGSQARESNGSYPLLCSSSSWFSREGPWKSLMKVDGSPDPDRNGRSDAYTLSLASRDGGKRIRSETAKKGMSGDRSMKSWEVRHGYRWSSRAVKRPMACSSDGGTCRGTGMIVSSGDTQWPCHFLPGVAPPTKESPLHTRFQAPSIPRSPSTLASLTLYAHLKLGPGTMHECQEALRSFHLC